MDNRFDWYAILHSHNFETLAGTLLSNIDRAREKRGLSKKQLSKNRDNEYQTIIQLLSALYSSYYSLNTNTNQVSLPLNPKFYTQSKFEYRVIRRVFDEMYRIEWIDCKKGDEYNGYTRIWPIGELEYHFRQMGLTWMPQSLIEAESLVILRDKDPENPKRKITLDVPETKKVQQYRASLQEYNQFITKHCIALDLDNEQLARLANALTSKTDHLEHINEQQIAGIDLSRVQLVRIFSRGNLARGGRFYRAWWQSLPSLYRPHITIDGYKTCEVDFSGVAIYILYAEKNIQFPHNRDPYDIGLENWAGKLDCRRKIIKRFLNAMLNDETGRFRLSKNEQLELGITHNELVDKLLANHEPIQDKLQSGCGLETQFIDSQIAQLIMSQMTQQNIVVLPIHDSFIVRLGYERDLKETMLEAFQVLTKSQGQTKSDYPRLSEHFGLTNNEFDKRVAEHEKNPASMIVTPEGLTEDHFRSKSLMESYNGSWEKWNIESQLL